MSLDLADNLMKIFGYERAKDTDKMPATIANDVCRGHDEYCAERNNCKRYTERFLGDGRISHCKTLYIICEGECANYIPTDTDDEPVDGWADYKRQRLERDMRDWDGLK